MPDKPDKKNDPNNTEGSNPEDKIIPPTEGDGSQDPPPEEPKDGQEKVQQVKHSDFKRIKEEAKAKGKQEALSELDAKAKEQGFQSWDDAMKYLGELKKTPPAKPAAPQPPKETPTMSTADKDKVKAQKEKERQAADAKAKADEQARQDDRKRWRSEERKRRELQAALDAKEAEMGLREEMWRAGVSDVDYTMRLLTRELEGKSEDEIAKYDRKSFYDKLKGERPYLFGEKVAPANTGTNGTKPDGSAPETPKPGDPSKEKAADQQFDARKAKPEEVQARLRALGLNPHM